jgi:hypothetical protein
MIYSFKEVALFVTKEKRKLILIIQAIESAIVYERGKSEWSDKSC